MFNSKKGKVMTVKRSKSIVCLGLIVLLFAAVFSTSTLAIDAAGAKTYFYDQLVESQNTGEGDSKTIALYAIPFYNTMKQMYEDETLLSGNKDGVVDFSDAKYAGFNDPQNRNLLLQAFATARDAFQYDTPDCFYLNWDELSVRVSGNTCVIGIGRSDDYLQDGFNPATLKSKVDAYNEKVDKVVADARKAGENAQTDDKELEIIRYVHDYLVNNIEYKYETQCSFIKNTGTVEPCNHRSAYDALIYGEGVCEAYTRAFKAIMDRLDIPTVCVFGMYRVNVDRNEDHIWNYVFHNGEWYGVDCTMDDPIRGVPTHDYFMVTQVELNANHVSNGSPSGTSYSFDYPMLLVSSPMPEKKSWENPEGFKVTIHKEAYSEGTGDEMIDSGTVCVSYKNKNYTENAKNGEYILASFATYDEEDGSLQMTDWAYITPDFYGIDLEPEYGTYPQLDNEFEAAGSHKQKGDPGSYLRFPLPHVVKVQFAVTDIEPDLSPEAQLNGSLYYNYYTGGDPSKITAMSEEVTNSWGTYVKPPYPKQCNPSMSGTLSAASKYHIVATFDEELTPIEGQSPSVEVVTESGYSEWDGSETAKDCKIDHVAFPGGSTVEFDFEPSHNYKDDAVTYNLFVKGLKGVNSQKEPFPVSYTCVFYSCVGCPRVKNNGGIYTAYGQPRLICNDDIATDGWQMLDTQTGEMVENESFSSKITNRLTLVVSENSDSKEKQLVDALPEGVTDAKTYNIQLSLCQMQLKRLTDGSKIKIFLGYPQGFDYDSSLNGSKFVAYHYNYDENGKIVEPVEEIECVATPEGLVIYCDSFSPFAIGMQKDTAPKSEPQLFVEQPSGGSIQVVDATSSDDLIKLDKPVSLRFVPLGGQHLSEVKINGVPVDISSLEGNVLTVDPKEYNLEDGKTYRVDATFIGDEAIKQDSKVNPEITPPQTETTPDITLPEDIDKAGSERKIPQGEDVSIEAKVDLKGAHEENNMSYQWYKDEVKLDGQTSRTLEIKDFSPEDNGTYYLEASCEHGILERSNKFKLVCEEAAVEPEPTTYTITTKVSPSGAGKVTGSGEYKEGETAVLEAVANSGYEFSGWEVGGEVTSKETKISVVVSSDETYTAVFTKKEQPSNPDRPNNPSSPSTPSGPSQQPENKVEIKTLVEPQEGGSITGSGSYLVDSDVKLTAKANKGYRFDHWKLNGEDLSVTDYVLSFKAKQSETYTAVFVEESTPVLPDATEIELSTDLLNLTTLEGGDNEGKVEITTSPQNAPFDVSIEPKSVAECSVDGKTVTVTAKSEGLAVLSVSSGSLSKEVTVRVVDQKFMCDGIQITSDDPDHFTVTAMGVRLNPAFSGEEPVKKVSIFTWSGDNQEDINAKAVTEEVQAQEVGPRDYSYTFTVNGTGANNYYLNTSKIKVHVYASNDESNGNFIGSYDHNQQDLYVDKNTVLAVPYVQDYGFITPSKDVSETVGTTGQAKQMEGIRLSTPIEGLDIIYRVHMANIGWSDYVEEGAYAGTMDEFRQLEAVEAKLTGANADKYDLKIQAHVADKGWLDAVGEGQTAGTTGEGRRLEAVRIYLVKK